MWRRRQGTTTPQKTNNNSIEYLVEREGNESLVADSGRMMIRMSNKLKEELKDMVKEEQKGA
jgi:hypothetical protein